MNPRLQAMMQARQAANALTVTPPPAPNGLHARAQVRTDVPDYNTYSDIIRITRLPTYHGMTEEELDIYGKMNISATAYGMGFRFIPEQAEAIAAYETCQGLLAPMGVGKGKTLATLCISEKAWKRGIEKIMLLIPSQLLEQLTITDIRWARSRVPISYPIHILGGRSLSERMMMAKSGKKGLYIWTYSLLSAKDASALLEHIRPQLLICDEVHNLAKPSAARTKRIREFVDRHEPQFCGLSGTITKKSIRDYYVIARWALREGCFLPLSASLANEWGAIIDAEATRYSDPTTGQAGPLMPLIRWAQQNFPQESMTEDVYGFRKAYRLRMNSAPGVVASGDASIGTSLILCNRPVPDHEKTPGWDACQDLMDKVTGAWLTPNGDEIEHAIHLWKWLNELSSGFYNQLTWPEADKYIANRPHLSKQHAEDMIEKAKEHHNYGQIYAKLLRGWLEDHSKPGLDTPFLVGREMSQNQGKACNDRDLYLAWLDWKNADFDGRPERDSTAIRVCPFKIDSAVKWCKDELPSGEGALIWIYHQEMGRWMYEALQAAGFNKVYYAQAGDNTWHQNPENTDKIVVASIKAHGTGKNLQHYHNQFFVQWPRSPEDAEQTIGRTHRTGQDADELLVYTNHTLEFDQLNFAACLNDALYIQQTTGNKQKLIIASYDPLPKIFPSAVLREKGLDNRTLTREQQAMLEEKFGQG